MGRAGRGSPILDNAELRRAGVPAARIRQKRRRAKIRGGAIRRDNGDKKSPPAFRIYHKHRIGEFLISPSGLVAALLFSTGNPRDSRASSPSDL